MTNHIVVTRPGYEVPPAPAELQDRIFFTDAVMKDISATNIRRLASEGRYDELEQMVPGPVANYIKKYGIYRDRNEAKLNH
jgi:nicotinic acid mononucleotide adenylyltransferase